MGLFDQFPYTNFHELNLDWLIKLIKELENTVNNFVALNTIKYADPIQWDITTQYEANTVVVDPQTGTAYISSKAVPSGVALTNTDYWSVIFTLDLISSNKNLTLRDDGSNTLATFASAAGDWLIWNGTLYKVSQTINVNEAYVAGYNITRYTVELFIADALNDIKAIIGDLTDLTTADKTSVVTAINEIVTNIGDLPELTTADKTNVVAAINEIVTTIGDLTDLTTIDKSSVVSAINETKNNYVTPQMFGAVGDGISDDTSAIQSALNYAYNNGFDLYFPAGNYLVSSTILLESDDVLDIRAMHIYGSNRSGYHLRHGNSYITCANSFGTSTPIFKFEKISNLYITNLSFFVDTADTTRRGLGLWLNYSSGSYIDNCNFYGFNRGLYLNESGIATVSNCGFTECWLGLHANNSGDSSFINNYINTNNHSDLTTDSAWYGVGIRLDTSSGSRIIGGKIEWNRTGVYMGNTKNLLIDSVTFDTNFNCSIFMSGNLSSCQISNSSFQGGGEQEYNTQILIRNTPSLMVSNCNFFLDDTGEHLTAPLSNVRMYVNYDSETRQYMFTGCKFESTGTNAIVCDNNQPTTELYLNGCVYTKAMPSNLTLKTIDFT